MKKIPNKINGFLVVDKPTNYTSRDIVNIISKKLNTKKVGHTGTLDPLATGVLIICIGKYTKLSELITNYDKKYIAQIVLGIATDTYDIEGKVIMQKKANHITKNDIINCLENFIGPQKQQVPIYSAVKVNGKKLYNYARNNEIVTLPLKDIIIKDLKLLDEPLYEDDKVKFTIECDVSKGTYIRSLINDIGLYLNTGATMTSLRRINQGGFAIDETYTLKQIENDEYKLLNIKDVFPNIDIIKIDDSLKAKVINGNIIPNKYHTNMCLFIDEFEEELAIYYKTPTDNSFLKPYKML